MRKCVPSPDVSSSTPRNLSNSTALCPPSTVNRDAFSALPAAPSAIAARATLVNRFTAFGALILAKSHNFFAAPAQPYLEQLHRTGWGGAEEKTPSKKTQWNTSLQQQKIRSTPSSRQNRIQPSTQGCNRRRTQRATKRKSSRTNIRVRVREQE